MLLNLPDELITLVILSIAGLDAHAPFVALACRKLREVVDHVVALNHDAFADMAAGMPVPEISNVVRGVAVRRCGTLSSLFSSPSRFLMGRAIAADPMDPLSHHLDSRTFTKRAAEQFFMATQRLSCHSFGGYRLSAVAVDAMLRTAPRSMICASFFEILGQTTRSVAVDFSSHHHRALVAYAAKHARIDVLSLLVPEVLVRSSYELQPGLVSHFFELHHDLSSRPNKFWVKHRELVMLLLCPAIRENRCDVLDWFNRALLSVERHMRPSEFPTSGLVSLLTLTGKYNQPAHYRASSETLAMIVCHSTFSDQPRIVAHVVDWITLHCHAKVGVTLLLFVALKTLQVMGQRHRFGATATWLSESLAPQIVNQIQHMHVMDANAPAEFAFESDNVGLVDLYRLAEFHSTMQEFETLNFSYHDFSEFRIEEVVPNLFGCGDESYVSWLLDNTVDAGGVPTETGFFHSIIDPDGAMVPMLVTMRFELDPTQWSLRESILRHVVREGCTACMTIPPEETSFTHNTIEQAMFASKLYQRDAWHRLSGIRCDTRLARGVSLATTLLLEVMIARARVEGRGAGDMHDVVTKTVEVSPVSFYDDIVYILESLSTEDEKLREAVHAHLGVGISNGIAWVQTARVGGLCKDTRTGLARRWAELVETYGLITTRGRVLMY